MSFYTDMRAIAGEVITEFGGACTLRKVTGTSREADSSSANAGVITETTTDYATTCVQSRRRIEDMKARISPISRSHLESVADEPIRLAMSAEGLVSAGVAPAKGDMVVWGGIEYTISELHPRNPDGSTDVAYVMDVT